LPEVRFRSLRATLGSIRNSSSGGRARWRSMPRRRATRATFHSSRSSEARMSVRLGVPDGAEGGRVLFAARDAGTAARRPGSSRRPGSRSAWSSRRVERQRVAGPARSNETGADVLRGLAGRAGAGSDARAAGCLPVARAGAAGERAPEKRARKSERKKLSSRLVARRTARRRAGPPPRPRAGTRLDPSRARSWACASSGQSPISSRKSVPRVGRAEEAPFGRASRVRVVGGVAEELRRDEGRREHRRVAGDEGATRAARAVVDDRGRQLFASAALALNEHMARAVRRARKLRAHAPPPPATPRRSRRRRARRRREAGGPVAGQQAAWPATRKRAPPHRGTSPCRPPQRGLRNLLPVDVRPAPADLLDLEPSPVERTTS